MKNIGAIAVLTKILAFNTQYERWIEICWTKTVFMIEKTIQSPEMRIIEGAWKSKKKFTINKL